MPPKKQQEKVSKKSEQKKKEKIIEDKTFGLKNKKGAKTQKYIAQVQKQVQYGNQSHRQMELRKQADKDKDKKLKEKEKAEMNALFRPVQKIDKSADPKSILCAFFKQGTCTKGNKCKFSHDMEQERKSEKKNLYVDDRDLDNDKMDGWDETKLMEVVEKKHGGDKKQPKTAIICKYFLDAVEKNQYGWFWQCPNGENCIYRHALPPGFVLQRDSKRMKEQAEVISLEELVEKERAALGNDLTKITLDTFLAWKKRKLKEKAESLKKEQDKRKANFKAGKNSGISGREMFTFNPDLVSGDQTEEGDETVDTRNLHNEEEEGEDNNVQYKDLVLENIAAIAEEVDGSGSLVASNNLSAQVNGEIKEEDKLEEAAGGEVPIDENLFIADDDDLDELDEDLEKLDIDDQ